MIPLGVIASQSYPKRRISGGTERYLPSPQGTGQACDYTEDGTLVVHEPVVARWVTTDGDDVVVADVWQSHQLGSVPVLVLEGHRVSVTVSPIRPLLDIPWAHVCWASDPLWTHPGDGNLVSSWRNASGAASPNASAAARPTYRASVASLNNQPAVEFDANDVLDAEAIDLPQPFSVVAIGHPTVAGGARFVSWGASATNANSLGVAGNPVAGWILNAGTALTIPSAPDLLQAHMLGGRVSGASSLLIVDEALSTSGDSGSGVFERLRLGRNSSSGQFLRGPLAFVGVLAGDLWTHPNWPSVAGFLRAFYGIA